MSNGHELEPALLANYLLKPLLDSDCDNTVTIPQSLVNTAEHGGIHP